MPATREGIKANKKVFDAWLDGAEVQFQMPLGKSWTDIKSPTWYVGYKYRVKPAEPRVFAVTISDCGILHIYRGSKGSYVCPPGGELIEVKEVM